MVATMVCQSLKLLQNFKFQTYVCLSVTQVTFMAIVVERVAEVTKEADLLSNTLQKVTLTTLQLQNGKEDNLLKSIGGCMLNIEEVMPIVYVKQVALIQI